jgi:hypothetical protein
MNLPWKSSGGELQVHGMETDMLWFGDHGDRAGSLFWIHLCPCLYTLYSLAKSLSCWTPIPAYSRQLNVTEKAHRWVD